MRRISTSILGLTLALTLTVVACGEDLTGVTSGDELTATEVAAVLAALGAAFEEAGGGPVAAPAQAPIDFDENFNVSVPCVTGNLVVSGSISGTIDDQTFATDLATTVTWAPNDCVVSDETNTFTINGAPQVDLVLNLTSDENGVTVSGSQMGGFSFESSDGRSGSSALNVTFNSVTDGVGTITSEVVSGTICGLNASGFEPLGV